MRAYELMMETLLRRRFILIMHLSLLSLYAAIFLPPLGEPRWQPLMIAGSGCLMPILISAGIFGDDTASGRISLLVTKPMHAIELYVWRAIGLMAQGLLHLLAALGMVIVLHHVTGRCNLDHAFAVWVMSLLLFCTWTALSVTVSVVVKREFNSVSVIAGVVILTWPLDFLLRRYPEAWAVNVYHQLLRYGLPPLDLMLQNVYKPLNGQWLLGVAQALGLTTAYGGLGMFLLARRQFPQSRD